MSWVLFKFRLVFSNLTEMPQLPQNLSSSPSKKAQLLQVFIQTNSPIAVVF